ncbi:MAG TPA: hypothetical protein VI076_05060 [Actinopolymorphaceae bacterium]
MTGRALRGAVILIVATVVVVWALSGCTAGPNPELESQGAGFFQGLWQGLISPITFVISLFTDDVSIYEVDNNGNWYDFGFMLGVLITLSGSGASGAAAGSRRR